MSKQKYSNAPYPSFVGLFFVFMVLIACRKKETMQPAPVPPEDTVVNHNSDIKKPATDVLPAGQTWLALGDSYTIGQSVDSSERFPAQTAALLMQQNIRFASVQYIAQTGWTTLDLQAAIKLQQTKIPFDAVTLLIGVNDQYQTHDTANYRTRFADLLNTAISLAGNHKQHVFVLSVPDYGVTPFGNHSEDISNQIDQFNAINREVTAGYAVHYIDVTTISRSDADDASSIAADGLHPSGRQYAQWARTLNEVMYEALK